MSITLKVWGAPVKAALRRPSVSPAANFPFPCLCYIPVSVTSQNLSSAAFLPYSFHIIGLGLWLEGGDLSFFPAHIPVLRLCIVHSQHLASMADRMKIQKTYSAYCQVKRRCVIHFQLCDKLEKAKPQRQEKDQWLPTWMWLLWWSACLANRRARNLSSLSIA